MVLVIIGLLLGAVLKGQELIGSARVFNLAQTINGYRTAVNGFQDRYRLMPGDSSAATTRIGNGAVNCAICCDNGHLDCWGNASLVNNHLVSAGFLSVPQLTVPIEARPTANGYLTNPGNQPIFVVEWDQFISTSGVWTAGFTSLQVHTGWNLSSRMLAELDRKIDDGNAWTGALRFAWGGAISIAVSTRPMGPGIENDPWPFCAAKMLF